MTEARRALTLARDSKQRGLEAWALRLLGKIAAQQEPPAVEQAEAHYRQARAIASELGMRPLLAHCHLGLGTLYAQHATTEGSACRIVRRHRALPGHGDDLLAPPGGGGAGGDNEPLRHNTIAMDRI